MNNLPENNNTNEEFSTIFSAPQEHNDTVKKSKKRYKTVLALFLVVAILFGGTFAVIKLIPKKETATDTNKDIEVVALESENIKEMTVKNKNGNFKFCWEETKTKSNETGETETSINWYIKGYDKELTDSDLILNIVNNVIDIDAIRVIDKNAGVDFGFEKPVATATFETTDNKKETVYVGAKSPDNSGAYVKLASKDEIYLVGGDIDETLSFSDIDLASTQPQPALMLPEKYSEYCSGVAVEKADYVTVEGVNFPEKMVFKQITDKDVALFNSYEVIEPERRMAQNIETIFLVFTGGFNTNGAYSYDVKSETLKKLKLDKPDFVLSAVFDDYTYSYKFKKQKDGNWAVIGNDSKNVKKVTLEDCNFLSYTTTDLYNPTVFMTNIDDVSNLTIKTQKDTYSFDIAANPNGDDTNKYKVTMGKKSFKSSYFQSFWQYLCMLQAIDFETEKNVGKTELTITYNYKNKDKEPTVVTFAKENAVRYQYSVDGVAMGKVGSSDYTKILKNLERLLEGKQVVVN